MNVTVLMTTWNRFGLLQSSLPLIVRECQRNAWPLVISDDQSDCRKTLSLLSEMQSLSNVDVWRREYIRDRSAVAHDQCQLNNLYAFERLLRERPEATHILKIDDDVTMIDGALAQITQMWTTAESQLGHRLKMMSGLRTKYANIIEQRDGYALTEISCNAAVLYRASDWREMLPTMNTSEVVAEGFDCYLISRWAAQGFVFASMTPGVVYHLGRYGTHGDGSDINVDFVGAC